MPSAYLYALAALETPRAIDNKSKAVVFNAQMYMGEGQQPLIANLQYFNSTGLTFDDVGVYFIHAMVQTIFHCYPPEFTSMHALGRKSTPRPPHLLQGLSCGSLPGFQGYCLGEYYMSL